MANTVTYREPVFRPATKGQQGFFWVRLNLDGSSTNGACTGFPSTMDIKTIKGSFGGFVKTDLLTAGVAAGTGFTGTGSANGTNGTFVDVLIYGEG